MQLHDYNLHTKLNKIQHSITTEAIVNDLEQCRYYMVRHGKKINFLEACKNMEADLYSFGSITVLKCQKLPMNVVSNDNKYEHVYINVL